jgi:hypothetical protein
MKAELIWIDEGVRISFLAFKNTVYGRSFRVLRELDPMGDHLWSAQVRQWWGWSTLSVFTEREGGKHYIESIVIPK